MTIDLDGPEPLYEQIAAILTARIADGTYPPRRRVPSEAQIVEEFGVSRPTARAATQLLVSRGLVVTVRGKGSFVADPKQEQRPLP
jgi:GntR family transcriptional regulator